MDADEYAQKIDKLVRRKDQMKPQFFMKQLKMEKVSLTKRTPLIRDHVLEPSGNLRRNVKKELTSLMN